MRYLLLFITLIVVNQLKAKTYYFSTISGNDSRSAAQAMNAATPWKTLAKLNAIFGDLNAGDSVLFKRGEVFPGSIFTAKSGSVNLPIVFAAYGTGARPVITGLTNLTNWTSIGGGIWESSSPSGSMLNRVLVNGELKEIGRYPNSSAPNKGYLNITAASGNSQITDNNLPSSPDWTGGDVVIRKARWVLDRNYIIRHSGNTIEYRTESFWGASANFGYFIQNHPKTLDVTGEWYYRPNDQKLGIYLASGNPSSYTIQASTENSLVSILSLSNFVFDNISFVGANNETFRMINSQQIRISNCDMFFSGIDAINAKNTNELTVENSTLNHTNNVAFNLDNCSNIIIRNCKIKNTGMVAGSGKGDSGSYEAILINGDNVLIEQNEIDSTGYIPITYRGNTNIIKNNFISNYAFVKDDAAGIYSWNNIPNAPPSYGTKIIGNIILYGRGASEGTEYPEYKPASGIYMDDNVSNVEITGNTVGKCTLHSLYVHNAHDLLIENNTFFDSNNQLVLTQDGHAAYTRVRNIRLYNNIFFAKEYWNRVADFKTASNDVAEFGDFNNNYYCRPVWENNIIFPSVIENGTVLYTEGLSLEQWKALFGKDQNSKKAPVQLKSPDLVRFEFNATAAAKTIPLDDSYIDVKNNVYPGSVTLQPYTSVILMKSAQGIDTTPASTCPGTGNILREEWNNITGNDIALIPVSTTPAKVAPITNLEASNSGEAFGARVRGFICPPLSGNYTFLISGDDQVELWLSTDDNATNKKKIASLTHWTEFREYKKFPSQTSAPINLQAGQRYYIEVLHKEGDGGDHFSVAWQLPNGLNEIPIPGSRLMPITNTPPTTSNGLKYKYYEGNWNVLPDFNTLAPVKTGSSPNVDISVRNAGVNNNFGFVWEGYINIPAAGNYTFETVSDDGSKLYFNSAYSFTGDALVSHDGLHAPWPATGNVYIPSAGLYPIALAYFEKDGGELMDIYWTGPGTSRQKIPDAAFTSNAPPPPTTSGLNYKYYEGNFNSLPDFNTLTPVKTGNTANIDLSVRPSGVTDHFAFVWEGYITIPTPGTYTFETISDDGSKLYFNSLYSPNGVALVNNDGLHAPWPAKGTITIAAGQYPISMTFFEKDGGETMQVYWTGPGIDRQLIPNSAFTNNVVPPSGCGTGTVFREQWNNVAGSDVVHIPVGTTPSGSGQVNMLESANIGDSYGERLRGYICPPQSGNYTFYIAGDDAVHLFLSTDENPGNKAIIAYVLSWTDFHQFNKFASQQSVPINLQAGRRYYIEVLHKEGAGGDHVSVAWKLPDGVTETPIAGNRLSPFSTAVTSNYARESYQSNTSSENNLQPDQGSMKVFPNPFKTSAKIILNPIEGGEATVEIYDLQGRKLQQLPSRMVKAGVQENFTLSAKGLSAGVYIIRISTKTKVMFQKIALSR